MSKQRVALLGTGTMGSGIARNLRKAGFPLTVYNRTREKAEPLADTGAQIADTPAQAVTGAAVVLSMLADDDALAQRGSAETALCLLCRQAQLPSSAEP